MSEEVTREQLQAELKSLAKVVKQPSENTLELTTLQKLITAVFIGGCLWVGTTVQSTSIKVARMEGQLEQATTNRYSSEDARRDFEAVNQRFIGHEGRLRSLEGRHQ